MDRELWHTHSLARVFSLLGTDHESGLSDAEGLRRYQQNGGNVFQTTHSTSFLRRFIDQCRSPLVIVLGVAGVATLILGDFIETIVIFISLAVNITIGFFQEARAGKAFQRLAVSQEVFATVLRSGKQRRIPAEQVVIGDVVHLQAGSKIPADVRLFATKDFTVNEAPLTGEWLAVQKEDALLKEHTVLAEQTNMGWMGTLVVSGTASGIVVATGKETQLGMIAESLAHTTQPKTPIQKSMRHVGKLVGIFVVGVAVILVTVGLIRGLPLETLLLLSVAVAVSVVPEGLPAVVTAVLAIGMERILAQKGLVRTLLGAETLGSTTVIFTDKTGTLTEGRMGIDRTITAVGHETDEEMLITCAVLASDAFVEDVPTEQDNQQETVVQKIHGNPVERGIVEYALRQNIAPELIATRYTRNDMVSFSSQRRMSLALVKETATDQSLLVCKASPEIILTHATRVFSQGKIVPMTQALHASLEGAFSANAHEGFRVVGIGYVPYDHEHIDRKSIDIPQVLLDELVCVGFLVFSDPIRSDAKKSIDEVRSAGATVFMLTGDAPATARSIADHVGITGHNGNVIEGNMLEKTTDEEAYKIIDSTRVFARVTPQHKLRLVELMQKRGEIVAMTGDGINDAPALQRADIGVAIGSGTDVAKEASDLVLMDDRFGTIVSAIREGRRISDNLKKVITLLLGTSFHEVFLVATSIFFGLPLPVLPIQLLWVNIIEESLLTFVFAFEPTEPDVMQRNPRDEGVRTIITKNIKRFIFTTGVAIGVMSIAIYLVLFFIGVSVDEIHTIMFGVLALDSIMFALSLKHLRRPFWHGNFRGNVYWLYAMIATCLGIVATLTIPVLREFLSLTPITLMDSLIFIGVGLSNLLIIEGMKWLIYKNSRESSRAILAS